MKFQKNVMASNSSSSSTTVTGPNQASQDEGFDELADSFAASFSVTNAANDTNRPHPRFAQYKMKSSPISQVRASRCCLNQIVTLHCRMSEGRSISRIRKPGEMTS